MKKLYFILIGFLVFGSVEAQIINFNDINFKNNLVFSSSINTIAKNLNGNYFRVDSNFDGEIQVSEALQVSELRTGSYNIGDLTEINNFTNLTYLECTNNHINTLNVTGLVNLKTLICNSNQLTSLNTTGLSNLTRLECAYNQLTVLNLNTLTSLVTLSCAYNQLTSIDLSFVPNLFYFECVNNMLTMLDASNLNHLKYLEANNNLLTSLNVSNSNIIERIRCQNNQLTSINTDGLTILKEFNCGNNQIQSLNLNQNPSLTNFNCENNLITSLNLSTITSLQFFYCSHNLLTNIIYPNFATGGATLDFSYNLFTELNLPIITFLSFNCSNNPQLQYLLLKNVGYFSSFGNDFSNLSNLSYVCVEDNSQPLTFIQNIISSNNYTNCNINSYCSFTPGGNYYTVSGNNKYDGNANGCDALDSSIPYLKYSIVTGTITTNLIANTSGNYTIPVTSGNYIIKPILDNPTYFNVSPTTTSVIFPNTASPYTQGFCITANGTHNDLEVTLLPIANARPGFDAHYQIVYKNKGTNTQNGSVNLAFNDAILDYVFATHSVTSQTINNLTWDFSNLTPFETRTIDVTLNLNSPLETPPLNSGDILNYTATVNGLADETATDNSSTLNQKIINSFDPNDKTCLEGTVVDPTLAGQYVHYIIRFENDGTANAQNIVVKDIIDTTKYDLATLVPIKGSAPFTTRINNTNQVEFIFQNINLPYTTGNNQGYVAFKIKTKPTLVLGDTFSNTANIYFDYNSPILTNTATTTIAALANPTFVFSDYFTLSPVPTKDVLNITSKQDCLLTSISIYNTLGQVMLVTSNPNTIIDVSNLATGSYFIKVLSDKGTSSSKFVKE